MSEFDHWMPLHVGDYLADTMHLSTLQHGVYIRLIMHYWKRRELVGDDRVLAQIAGLPYASFRRIKDPVLALFILRSGNLDVQNGDRESRFSHRRLDIEIERAIAVSEQRKALGRQGASARWDKRDESQNNGKSHAFANAMRARATPTATATATEGEGTVSPPELRSYPSTPPKSSRKREDFRLIVGKEGNGDGR